MADDAVDPHLAARGTDARPRATETLASAEAGLRALVEKVSGKMRQWAGAACRNYTPDAAGECLNCGNHPGIDHELLTWADDLDTALAALQGQKGTHG